MTTARTRPLSTSLRRVSQRTMVSVVAGALVVLVYQLWATTTQSQDATRSTQALAILPAVTVAEPDPARTPYKRDAYQPHGWADADGDGCNTRREVLIVESTKPVSVNPDGCKISDGRWVDRFTGTQTSSDANVQIDHLVALADADRSGAWRWPQEKKLAFANDLDNPDELNAISNAVNQAKSDKAPDEWMPENKAARCDYLRAYVTIKSQWQLSVSPAQWQAIAEAWPDCTTSAPRQ